MNTSHETIFHMAGKTIRSGAKLMMARVPILAVALLLTAAVSYWMPGSAKAAFATTYFVRTDGSNMACNGLTNASAASAPNCAFSTIQFAVTTASSGDTINVAAGTYNESQILIEKSISVLGANTDTTIINGGNTPLASAGLVRINLPLTDTGNVTFSGFTVTNPGLTGSNRYHIFGKPISPLSTVTVSNNKITGANMAEYGFYSDRPVGSVVFAHNEITNVGANPILIERPVGATDVHHNTISGNIFTAYFSFTYTGNDVTTKQRVADNIFNGSNATAISINGASPIGGGFGKYTNVEITNNVITQLGTNRIGINLTNGASTGNGALGAIENPVITGNTITGTDLAGSKGIRLLGLITNATIRSNDIRDVDRGFSGEVNNGHSATGTQINFNNIVNNVNGAVWDGSAPINAENNWWGCNFGPGTGGAGCLGTPNGIVGTGAANVDADPWLVLSLTAAPTTVSAGGNSALTAKLTINSDGVDTAPGTIYVPDGTVAGFGATLGTVMPMSGMTNNGVINSTFTAGMIPGMASASSSIDGQTVTAAITISCVPITISPMSLPTAQVNVPYPPVLTASPAGGMYTFTVMSGNLPTGLTLNPDGSFSGAATQTGSFTFTVKATGFEICTGTRTYTIIVQCPTITIAPASLAGGTVGTAYSQSVSASPAGIYSFTVSSGAPPPGLSLATDGSLTGTPTAAGIYNFIVRAASGGCQTTKSYSITVACAMITLGPASLPSGPVGSFYDQTINVSPTGTYTFSLIGGSLPNGLSLNPATGRISGMPTVVGNYSFRIKAQAGGCSATQQFTLAITCPVISVNPMSLPNGTRGAAYSQTISASPAGGNYTYTRTSGSLPSGLNLNATTGVLSGTPTVSGTFTFTVTAKGWGNCTQPKEYTLVIN